MPLRKRIAPKVADEVVHTQTINSLLNNVTRMRVMDLVPHPKNPRQGNIQAVAESLSKNGQFKPIVVQKSNRIICAGNHTWLAARSLGWTHIDAVLIDVDDDVATRVLLADNKTSDGSTYDDQVLAEILAGLAASGDSLEGTGYNAVELQDIIDSVGKHIDQNSVGKLNDLLDNMPKTEMRTKTKREEYLESEEDDEEAHEGRASRGATKANTKNDDAEQIDDIEDAEAELQAVLEVKVENVGFWKQAGKDGGDDFEIPTLRDDMLMEEIPDLLKTWAGHDVTPDDGKSWFLYNYSLGGIKGLPFERAILGFNTHDDRFEGWWDTPAWYTCRVLAKGCRNAVVPDFSFYYNQPRIVHLWNVYRSLWLGRFFQEAGMKVVPRLQFDYKDPNTLDIALRGVPRGCPVLATSQQNIEDDKVDGPQVTKLLREALDEIKPESLIFYSGPPGKRAMQATGWTGDVIYLENYVSLRREKVFGRKDGLQGKTAKDRAKVLNQARKRLAQTPAEPPDDEEN